MAWTVVDVHHCRWRSTAAAAVLAALLLAGGTWSAYARFWLERPDLTSSQLLYWSCSEWPILTLVLGVPVWELARDATGLSRCRLALVMLAAVLAGHALFPL